MEDLPENIQGMLREFRDSVFFPAYREYVLTEAGRCLGQIRTSQGDDAYTKGVMHGLEKLFLDLNADLVETGSVEKANHENREYTKELLNKNIKSNPSQGSPNEN